MNGNDLPEKARRDDRPLDDVMLAMDVVDTLRHRASLVERELNTEDRDRQLVDRLRDLYASQGIDVPDEILAEGVKALGEDRFVYDPPEPSFQVTLARIYVSRGRWSWWVFGITSLLVAALIGYWLLVAVPRSRRLQEIPRQLAAQENAIVEQAETESDEAAELAKRLSQTGRAALDSGDVEAARAAVSDLKSLREQLELEYELRIVQKGLSGVFRIPDANEETRNYYVIVRAVTPDGNTLTMPTTNEEDGNVYNVSTWGLRVDEETYEKVKADKMDDGIIQDNRFGIKRSGQLKPVYLMPTQGGAITSWQD